MIKKDKFIISKISVFCVGLVFATVLYFFSQENKSEDVHRSDFRELINAKLELKTRLEKRWLLGDIEEDILKGKINCPLLEKGKYSYHSSFLECNPLYLECFLKSEKSKKDLLNIKINKSDYSFKYQKQVQFDRRQNIILSFLDPNNKEFKIKLFNSCKDRYLPKGKYSAGPKGTEYVWDNIDQNIFIDKTYITNLDIYLWNNKIEGNLFEPSTNLSLVDRVRYCQSVGKQLLESRYFDAASFYRDTESINPNYIFKFPYPWTKKRKLNLSEGIKERDCGNLYSRDCENIRVYKYHEPNALTWIGIYKSLGSYPELMVNKFKSQANLKLSSFYLPFFHEVQEVGKRVSYKNNEIQWIDPYTNKKIETVGISEIKVGFRCSKNL